MRTAAIGLPHWRLLYSADLLTRSQCAALTCRPSSVISTERQLGPYQHATAHCGSGCALPTSMPELCAFQCCTVRAGGRVLVGVPFLDATGSHEYFCHICCTNSAGSVRQLKKSRSCKYSTNTLCHTRAACQLNGRNQTRETSRKS